MLLLTGPPASGKTSFCIERIREHLRARDRNWRLLVPTATLGEHLRNQLARERFVFSPAAISTLAKFVDSLVPELAQVPAGMLEIMTAEALARQCPVRYLPVRDFAGFRRALASAIEEFVSSGADVSDLPREAADFAGLVSAVVASVRARGLNLNPARLRAAKDKAPGDVTYYLAGFYSFNTPELDFIRTLATRANVTLGISEWAGSRQPIAILRTFATDEMAFVAVEPTSTRTVFTAPTLDGELTEIARRIHAEHELGRPWRDIGIVVRSEQPYVEALRCALERFGIPARFYFGSPLAQHPVIRFLTSLVDCALQKWDHAATLEALRLAGSPLEHADTFDYAVRSQLPGAGLSDLAALAGPSHDAFFQELDQLTSWATAVAPAAVWADRFSSVSKLCKQPDIHDGIGHDSALLLRARAVALQSWHETLTTIPELFGRASISCEQFHSALCTVLDSTSLRPPDHRRDVVHVMDAFEARQWRLPLVFICGLVEKQFPKYHSENPILGDGVRRHLQDRGIPLRTSVERQADEQFLFDCALSCASDRAVVSYPVLNAKADANLASFFIDRAQPFVLEASRDVRPMPLRARSQDPHSGIFDEQLRAVFAARHAVISASAIEMYLQCPYQFFAQSTLKLSEPPAEPWSRLDPLVQGNIAHAVLERVYGKGQSLERAFSDVFAKARAEHRIPDGYRTEAIRLDLLHNLYLVVRDVRLKPGIESLFEKDFRLALGDGTVVRGRIDRVEVDDCGRAVVFDYKYSSKNSVLRTENGHDEKLRVQGGLYLLALPGIGDYTPAGMVYAGFKRELSFGGWIIRPYHGAIKKDCGEDRLQEIMRLAREAALEASQKIRSGDITPSPADEARCEFCSCANICRVEMTPVAIAAEVLV